MIYKAFAVRTGLGIFINKFYITEIQLFAKYLFFISTSIRYLSTSIQI